MQHKTIDIQAEVIQSSPVQVNNEPATRTPAESKANKNTFVAATVITPIIISTGCRCVMDGHFKTGAALLAAGAGYTYIFEKTIAEKAKNALTEKTNVPFFTLNSAGATYMLGLSSVALFLNGIFSLNIKEVGASILMGGTTFVRARKHIDELYNAPKDLHGDKLTQKIFGTADLKAAEVKLHCSSKRDSDSFAVVTYEIKVEHKLSSRLPIIDLDSKAKKLESIATYYCCDEVKVTSNNGKIRMTAKEHFPMSNALEATMNAQKNSAQKTGAVRF